MEPDRSLAEVGQRLLQSLTLLTEVALYAEYSNDGPLTAVDQGKVPSTAVVSAGDRGGRSAAFAHDDHKQRIRAQCGVRSLCGARIAATAEYSVDR